jgi:dGTPase
MRRHANNHLASYAMRVEESQGRRYPEPAHPFRNDYERDRDRIIHSRAFRRLENKTQVFTRRYSDHFRNRLTHTLEVAQISRTVAKALGLNRDLVEALALVHDVGHPPFGHAGEAELNRLMTRHQDSFDHNLHALRIVEHFEQKYAEFPGLNLTFEVREGIIKHSREYDPALYPELAAYDLEARPPLEAQLIDPADEIAYNCADLDDGYEARLLTLPLVRQGLGLFDSLYRTIDRKYPTAREKLKFNEALKAMLNLLVTDLIQSTRGRLAEARVRSVAEVRAHPRRLVGLGPRRARDNRELKEFLNVNLYSHHQVGSERKGIVRLVRGLFNYYLEHPRALPAFYFAQSQHEPLHRVVCDYVAGMTDNYLQLQYRRHLGPRAEKL